MIQIAKAKEGALPSPNSYLLPRCIRSSCAVLRSTISTQLKRPSPALLSFNLVQLFCACKHDRKDLHIELRAIDSGWAFWIERDISLHKEGDGWRLKLTTELQTALSYLQTNDLLSPCLIRLHKCWTHHHKKQQPPEPQFHRLFSFDNISCYDPKCNFNHSRALIYFYLLSDLRYNWIPIIWQDIERSRAAHRALEQSVREALILTDPSEEGPTQKFMNELIGISQRKELFGFGYRYALSVLCISMENQLPQSVIEKWRHAFQRLCYDERCDYYGADCPLREKCTKFHSPSEIGKSVPLTL